MGWKLKWWMNECLCLFFLGGISFSLWILFGLVWLQCTRVEHGGDSWEEEENINTIYTIYQLAFFIITFLFKQKKKIRLKKQIVSLFFWNFAIVGVDFEWMGKGKRVEGVTKGWE
jgi:hypothetical protein